MGFLKALFSTVNARAKAEQNVENFVQRFCHLTATDQPPVIKLYDTYMKMTSMGMIHEWFRTPPVVNNVIALYSCLTPPNCAEALAHQLSITLENKIYKDPNDKLSMEYRRLMREITTEDGDIDTFKCMQKFVINNGSENITHPDNLIEFSLSHIDTIAMFIAWNRTANVNEMLL